MTIRQLLISFAAIWSLTASSAPLADEESQPAIDALTAGGYVALMRHALAPGMGDPANFTLGDCSTQRNLDETGRRQAVATGAFFKEQNIDIAAVYSSQWCRCMETAELLQLAPVVELPPLNSFFGQMQESALRTKSLQKWLAQNSTAKTLLLVTHQVNITALSGVYPASGEIVVGKVSEAGVFTVVGSVAPF